MRLARSRTQPHFVATRRRSVANGKVYQRIDRTPRSSAIPLMLSAARREAHKCVTADGRNPALAESSRAHAPAVVANGVLRRSAVIRPTVHNHLTPGTPANDHWRCSKSAVSFRRTTISNVASGNDREGRASRSWSWWPAQMLCVTPGSSSGFRSPRSPGLPSPRHHAQTTFIVGSAMRAGWCLNGGSRRQALTRTFSARRR